MALDTSLAESLPTASAVEPVALAMDLPHNRKIDYVSFVLACMFVLFWGSCLVPTWWNYKVKHV